MSRLGPAIIAALLFGHGVIVAEDESEPYATVGGEFHFRAGVIDGDEGFGRTGGAFEQRFLLDASIAPRLTIFTDIGASLEQIENGGMWQQRLYLEYAVIEDSLLSARAGWVRVPFGPWDALTMTRPIIKDREFFNGEPAAFQIRRSSFGVALHSAPGVFEMDLAYLNRGYTDDFSGSEDEGRDLCARLGISHHGLSFGASVLKGLDMQVVADGEEEIDLGAVTALGADAAWSLGLLTVGGEVIIVNIDGRRSTGWYAQSSLDLSPLVRGLRVLAKYDVLDDGSSGKQESFRRITYGTRVSLRRDLDLEIEVDRDLDEYGDEFGGTHVTGGVGYRF